MLMRCFRWGQGQRRWNGVLGSQLRWVRRDSRRWRRGQRLGSGVRAAGDDLTQVRSAPPTCKRTPHCKYSKHGGRVRL
ncbi:hypothetical protein BHM03_00055833, partial [Ensete ventricosum]